MKKIIDLHTHLTTLQNFVQLRSKIQSHKISISDHLHNDKKIILNISFYMQFYQSYESLISLVQNFCKDVSENKHIKIIKTKEDLNSNFNLGLIFHLESARLITNPQEQIKQLKDLGFKGVIPVHFIDNQYGTSCDDFSRRLKIKTKDSGLTSYGKDLIKICNAQKMWIDISHATDQMSLDILKNADHIIASHVAFREIKNFKRNIPLEIAKEINNKGGLIGLIPWTHLIPNSKDGYSEEIEFGVKHGLSKSLSIGTDFGAPIKTHSSKKSIFDLGNIIEKEFSNMSEDILWNNAFNFYQKLF